MSWKDFDPGKTGQDPSKWSEKTVADCPQRGRQGELDLTPDNSFGDFSETHLPSGDFYDGSKFSEKLGASSCMLDYDDLGSVDNNEPVPQRKSWDFYEHGYRKEPGEALPGQDGGKAGKPDRA